jgi:hypothetical protein
LQKASKGVAMRKDGPISPDEVVKAKGGIIPNFVYQAFNNLIAKYWDGRSAVVKQPEVVGYIVKLCPNAIGRPDVFDKGWLDVEEVYRAAGWKVKYDKPGYNESYDAYFVFSKE